MPGIYITSSDDQTVKMWEQQKLFRDVIQSTRLSKFISKDGGSIVHEKVIGSNERGDTVTYTLIYKGSSSFLPPRTLIRGNENGMITATDKLIVDEANLGYITGTDIDKQRSPYDMDSETRRITVSAGAEALDRKMFAELVNTDNVTDYFYIASGSLAATATRATAKAAVTATDKLTPEFAGAIRRWAISNRVNGRVPVQPIMIDGYPMLIWWVSGDVAYDIRNNSTWASAVKDASDRGRKNPLFTTAAAYYDGNIFIEDEFVNEMNMTNAGAGGNVNAAESIVTGAQALLFGRKGMPRISEEKISHGQQTSYAYISMIGVKKPEFTKTSTKKMFGSLNVITARSQITDISVS